jgi:uncharacterized protein involved in exopolysaccharide biosynthesis
MTALTDIPFGRPARPALRLRRPTLLRVLRGGDLGDGGRLPRYAAFLAAGVIAIWAPIGLYLQTAPQRFTTEMSLILPGAGATASLSLNQIGQASSYATSPFASSSVSPTETYKRLIGADRILQAAAERLGMRRTDFGNPTIKLVDQTGLIRIEVGGTSPEDAQDRGDALLAAFFAEVDALRSDEIDVRADGGKDAIETYRASVAATRAEIAALQRRTGLISTAQYRAMVAETDILRQRVRDAAETLEERTEAWRRLQDTLGITPRLAAATLKLHADSEVSAIIAEMADQAARLAALRGRHGPNHPAVATATSAESAARARVLARARRVTGLPPDDVARLDLSPIGARGSLLARLVETDAEREGLSAALAELRGRLAETEARVMALIEPAARLEDLERDFSVAEAVFASAIARAQSSRTDLFASYPLVQVLENPSLPEKPSSPRAMLALAAGAAATLMLLAGLALAWVRGAVIARLLAAGAAA